ncbi:cupin domain-containing protein [Chitinimonas sp. BJB300]|uniref:cupin domain-containing protein n=1 Tax=Chitinimonas sp. BJB300 TaxID=1559339 RepID=UPI000C0FBBD0|nr:cupin domain-containing protein [Chitinimonas sp. BJB300]PHV12356.1 cupin [Chitinimonas sp. BJB300]TSJ91066.1 cupin [Chitinimonas sp. BJB300]
MFINADFGRQVIIPSDTLPWVASPVAGVERRMLDRIGGEKARATTIVRYAPGSGFTEHAHAGGEEILVLDGVFSDENGDYPAGTYIRNPSGSSHTPFSKNGCTLFVKLHQFDHDDVTQIRIDTLQATWYSGVTPGLSVLPLHAHGTENVALVRWAPGTHFNRHRHWGGEEILVLEGTFQDEHGIYPAGTWMRSPHLSGHTPFSVEGCLIYVKTGHLLLAAEQFHDEAIRAMA